MGCSVGFKSTDAAGRVFGELSGLRWETRRGVHAATYTLSGCGKGGCGEFQNVFARWARLW